MALLKLPCRPRLMMAFCNARPSRNSIERYATRLQSFSLKYVCVSFQRSIKRSRTLKLKAAAGERECRRHTHTHTRARAGCGSRARSHAVP